MLIDNSLQRKWLEIINEQDNVNMSVIFFDIIEEHRKRASEVYGLRQRKKIKSASEYYDFQESTNERQIHDGVPIFARQKLSDTKINHRLHNDYFNSIISNKTGYMPKLVVETTEESEKTELELLNKQIKLNKNYITQIANMVGWGASYILLYNDITGNIKMVNSNADETVVIRNQSTNEVEYAMRYWRVTEIVNGKAKEKYRIEWYDNQNRYTYLQNENNFELQDIKLHTFDRVPIFEFINNTDAIGDCEYTLELQDAYDIALSDLSSETTQMRLAYLVVKNLGSNLDNDFIQDLINTGVFAVSENGDAKFLEKNLNDEAIQNLLKTLDSNIWKFSNSYDPSSLGSEKTAYEIRQKLKRLTDSCNTTKILYFDVIEEVYKTMISWLSKWKSINIDVNSLKFSIPYQEPKNNEAMITAAKNAGMPLSPYAINELLGLNIDVDKNIEEYNKFYGMTGLADDTNIE